VEALQAEQWSVRALRGMIGNWSPVPGMGIPQGQDASRVLGNVYLYPVDRAMERGPWVYLRFLDDIRILGETAAQAIEGIRTLERECKKMGLVLSAQKTALLTKDQAQADFDDDHFRRAQYLIQADRDQLARQELRKILRKAMGPRGQVRTRGARFSLWRLRALRDRGGLRLVLERLEDLAPVAPILAAYIRPWLTNPKVEEALTVFLSNPERNVSRYLTAWLFAAMLDRSAPLPSAWTDHARGVMQNRNEPDYHRVLAANVLARGRFPTDLSWIRREIRFEYNPVLVRGYVVALARVQALDRSTLQVADSRGGQVKKVAEFIRGRPSLPSLVYRGVSNPLD